MKRRQYVSVHHSRYKYLTLIWRLVSWATSHLGHVFTHVFTSTDQSICEENARAVTAEHVCGEWAMLKP